ncbi:MFS transporter [Embleya sp. NBC_00896]|uniref:MFS transporter n=1 Tax=Embleya sp. NBC_00896 TaxID=2975961 RepID=UPI002F917607|nr:MFS transporter [Embleya sp. NBC_00896]
MTADLVDGSVEPVAETTAFPLRAAIAACAAFVLIGALQALYGPAIPALRREFGISPATAGLALSAHFAGALLGVLAGAALRRRRPDRQLLLVSCLFMAVGAVAFAVAADWPFALAAVFVLGVGFGGIDYGLNVMFAEGFGRRGTSMLNILNAHFGLGAIAGPALLGALGADRYPAVFAGCAVACVLVVPPLLAVRDTAPAAGPAPAPPDGTAPSTAPSGTAPPNAIPPNATPPRTTAILMGAFIVLYILHVGIETGVGGWEPTHLEALGNSTSAAAGATAGFWLAMTIGRFLVAPISLRVRPQVVVLASCAAMTGFLLLAAVPPLAPYAYLGVGLAIAPIFPTGLAWLNERVPGSASAAAWVIAASMIGGIAFPPLLGAAFETSADTMAIPLLLAALSAVCTAVGVACGAIGRRARPVPNSLTTTGS